MIKVGETWIKTKENSGKYSSQHKGMTVDLLGSGIIVSGTTT